jgi:hypothetical protein
MARRAKAVQGTEAKEPELPVEFTVWDNSDGYDVNRAYMRSRDPRGDRDQGEIRVTVPASMLRECRRVLSYHPEIGWVTPQDVMRDAFYHRLHWWAEEAGDVELSEALAVERRLVAARERGDIEKMAKDYIEVVRSQLETCKYERDHAGIAAILKENDESAEVFRPFWAEKLEAVVKPYRPAPALADGE